MPIATAIVAAAVIGGVGSYLGGQAQAGAARSAARTQAGATDRATAATMEMFEKNLELNAPFREAGYDALKVLQGLAESSPNYESLNLPTYKETALDIKIPEELHEQFEIAREDADRYVNRLGATRGNLFSGATMELADKSRRRINAEEAVTGYDAGFRRSLADREERRFAHGENVRGILTEDERKRYFENLKYGRYQNLVNIGRGAATSGANAAITTGANLSSLYQSGGANQARLRLAEGEAISGIYSGVANAAIGGAGAYSNYRMNQDLIDSLNKPYMPRNPSSPN